MDIIESRNLDIEKIIIGEAKKNKWGNVSVPIYYGEKGNTLRIKMKKNKAFVGVAIWSNGQTKKYSLPINLSDGNLIKFFKSLEEKISKHVFKNHLKIYGKPAPVEDAFKELFSSLLKLNKDYNPQFKMKVPSFENQITSVLWHKKEKLTSFDIPKGSIVDCIMSCTGVWAISGRYGLGFKLEQCKIRKYPQITNTYAFDSDTEDNSD
jgi:hypothetical protein